MARSLAGSRTILVVVALAACGGAVAADPFHEAEPIFPVENWHNHASSVWAG